MVVSIPNKTDCFFFTKSSICIYIKCSYWRKKIMTYDLWLMTSHVLQARYILCTNPLTTDLLYRLGANGWKFMTKPVSVGLQYHVEDNFRPIRITIRSISRNEIFPFCSTSIVNFKFWCSRLIWRSVSSISHWRIDLITSSI